MKLTVQGTGQLRPFPLLSGKASEGGPAESGGSALAYRELEAIADRFIDELAGGQRQRAMIAMVIAQDTDYILLDEPTNNLDIYHASNMMKMVRRLCDELGKTVILVCMKSTTARFTRLYLRFCRWPGSAVRRRRKSSPRKI